MLAQGVQGDILQEENCCVEGGGCRGSCTIFFDFFEKMGRTLVEDKYL